MKYVSGIGLCLMLSPLAGHASWEPNQAIDAAPFKTKAASIVDLIGKENEKLGFGASLPFNPKDQIFPDDEDGYYYVPTIELKDTRNGYFITFLQTNGQVIHFLNNHILEDLYEVPKGKLYDQAPAPQWTPEHAIEIAKHFLPLILDQKDVILGAPKAQYQHHDQIPKHFTGSWSIGWPRVDNQGRLFIRIEDVSMEISEERGLFSFRVNLPSTYQEKSDPVLKSDDVLAAAQKAAEQTTAWPPAAQWFQNGMIEPQPRSSVLRVVTPNHLLTSKDLLLKHDLNARLAWVFAFAWHPNDDPKKLKPIYVWMDAHTGEYLGGDLGISAQ